MNVTVTTKNINKGTSVRVSLSDADGLTASATDIDSDGKSVVTIKGTPKKEGTATLKVTVDGKTVSASFTINKEASNVVLKTSYDTTDDATFATVKTYTGTVGYQNAWMLTPVVKVVDNQGTDKSADFDMGGSLTLIKDNNADAQTFTVATKTTTKVGDYKIVVTLGDQKTEQTIKVVTATPDVKLNLSKPTDSSPLSGVSFSDNSGKGYDVGATTWEKSDDGQSGWASDTGNAANGKWYRATATLTAKEGYSFTGFSASVTISDYTVTVTPSQDGKTATVVATLTAQLS